MGTRTVRAVQLTVLGLLAGVGLLASPAHAQEGEAFITVDQAHPASGSTHYFVSVTDAAGDLVTDTEVTATPISPDGEEGETVTLTGDGSGVFQGSVPMNDPGEWTVRFTSSDPAGTTEATQRVSAASTPIESVPPDDTGTPEAGTPETGSDDTAAPAVTEDDDSSALPLVLLLVGLAAVAVLAVVLYLRSGPEDGVTPPPAGDSAPD